MKKSSRLSKWVNISIGLSILGLIGSHFHSKIVPPEETEADKSKQYPPSLVPFLRPHQS